MDQDAEPFFLSSAGFAQGLGAHVTEPCPATCESTLGGLYGDLVDAGELGDGDPIGSREHHLPLPAAELARLPEQPATEFPVADGFLQHLRLPVGDAQQQTLPALPFPVAVDAQPHGDRGQERPEPVAVQVAVGRRPQHGLLDAVLGVMKIGQSAAHQTQEAFAMLEDFGPERIAA